MASGLELVVTKSIVGTLETNIATLEKFVARSLENYVPEKYAGDADAARKDRAELNKSKKILAEKRKEIIDELMKPYKDFEERCRKLEKDIDRASAALDAIVKERENSEKDSKRAEIKEAWKSKGFTLFALEKIWSERWLNKTYKMESISKEMDSAIERTYAELKDIERLAEPDCLEDAKARYLFTLDAGDAVLYARKIKENRERAAREAAERSEREHAERIAEQRAEVSRESGTLLHREEIGSLAARAAEIEDIPETAEYTITISVTEATLLAIKNYLTAQGVEFHCERLEF